MRLLNLWSEINRIGMEIFGGWLACEKGQSKAKKRNAGNREFEEFRIHRLKVTVCYRYKWNTQSASGVLDASQPQL
jgi:hypothetical protein